MMIGTVTKYFGKEANDLKKALMMASVASMIDMFNMENIRILKKLDCKVDVACNIEQGSMISQERIENFKQKLKDGNHEFYQLPVPRSITSIGSIVKSYQQMKKLCETQNYNVMHCHSPIGGAIARMACKNVRKNGTKVIYTAHGFHFYKGAPLPNWLLFYPIERWLSRYTDVLITINKEDYHRAKSQFKAKRIEYVPGIGIDTEKFSSLTVDKGKKRQELGLPEDAFVALSVGELNKNKNHEIVIKAVAGLQDPNVHYVICGQGSLDEYLRELSRSLGIEKQIHLLGFRKDVPEISKASDLFVFPSFREGLSVALMESMANGLPIVCSNIRGNSDLVEEGINGFLVDPADVSEMQAALDKIISDKKLQIDFGKQNLLKAKNYDKKIINKKMEQIYMEVIK